MPRVVRPQRATAARCGALFYHIPKVRGGGGRWGWKAPPIEPSAWQCHGVAAAAAPLSSFQTHH